MIEIINGDHTPPHPFMIVSRYGLHVDMSTVVGGQLWDGPTTRRIVWGLRDGSGATFGRVELKNGTSRAFYDPDLMVPYVRAYQAEREKRQSIAA